MPQLWTRIHLGRLLSPLLGVDLLLITLHVLSIWSLPGANGSSFLASSHFRIDVDRGIPEIFQYLKLAGIVGLLGAAWYRDRSPPATAWAVVYVLLDDALSVHERYGAALADAFALAPAYGVCAQDVGEWLVWASVGFVLAALVVRAYMVGSTATLSMSTRRLPLLFGALAFFGVVVDAFHSTLFSLTLSQLLDQGGEAAGTGLAPLASSLMQSPFAASWTLLALTLPALSAAPVSLAAVADLLYNAMLLDTLLTVLEDGGEMIVVSLILYTCLAALRPTLQPTGRLYAHKEVREKTKAASSSPSQRS